MPCRSDYMDPTPADIKLGTLLCIKEELDNGVADYSKAGCRGEQSIANLDALTDMICTRLKRCVDPGVSVYSLELQMWWRDHQAADARREQEKITTYGRVRELMDDMTFHVKNKMNGTLARTFRENDRICCTYQLQLLGQPVSVTMFLADSEYKIEKEPR
jgi:hypothetical protein